jgi:tRNA(Ile)-lysidine synthase
MAHLHQQFFKLLTGSCRVKKDDRLVVAVSGGPDSMALLHLLAETRKRLHLELTAVWVDHGLRPLETPEEKKTIVHATRKLEVPFFPLRVDVAGFAAEHHLSTEHAARELRYTMLRQVASDVQAEYIAVAHTADDQTEEILIRLLRGSGRKGLAGMSVRSNDLIRPLLQTEKSELLNWLQEKQIQYCIDSTNQDLQFLRNRVRHRLLPFLEQHFGTGIRKSLRKTGDSLAEDEQLLAELTDNGSSEVIQHVETSHTQDFKTLRILRRPFCKLHSALQRRVIEQLLWQIGSKAGYDHILLILDAAANGRTNSELHLSRGLRVGIFRDYLEFSFPAGQIPWRGSLFS